MNKLKGRKIEAKKSFYLVHLLYDGNFQKYPNFFKPVLQTGLTHKGNIIVGISQWKFWGGGTKEVFLTLLLSIFPMALPSCASETSSFVLTHIVSIVVLCIIIKESISYFWFWKWKSSEDKLITYLVHIMDDSLRSSDQIYKNKIKACSLMLHQNSLKPWS